MGMGALSEGRIKQALAKVDAGSFGAVLEYHPEIDSTNDRARELAETGAVHGTLVIADQQHAGRGRRGREWEAPPKSSLLATTVFRPELNVRQAYRIVMVCGLAIAQAVEHVAAVQVDVKWPNDLLLDGKKFAGILPETAIFGEQLAWVIVGTGINVNQQFEQEHALFNIATSLRMTVRRSIDRAELLAALCEQLNLWYAQVTDNVLEGMWQRRCVTLGKRIRVEASGVTLEGVADELDANGALWLQLDHGERQCLTIGETTILDSRT